MLTTSIEAYRHKEVGLLQGSEDGYSSKTGGYLKKISKVFSFGEDVEMPMVSNLCWFVNTAGSILTGN